MKAPGPGASIPCLVASILLLTALSGHLCLSAAPQEDSSSVLSADPRFKHGHQLVEQGRFSEAAAQFKELQEFFPGSPLLFNLLGFCNLQQGFRDLAIQDFQKAIALQPEFKPAHNNLAGIYLSQGRTRDAISEFEEVVRIDPKDSQDYFNLARAELAVNDRRSGLEYLNKAYALAPANVAVTMALAQLDLEDGHLEAGRPLAEKLGSVHAGDARAELQLANLLLGYSFEQAALEHIRSAQRADTRSGELVFALAM